MKQLWQIVNTPIAFSKISLNAKAKKFRIEFGRRDWNCESEMKFHVVIFCLVQMCLGSENATDSSELEQKIRDKIPGASEQFIENVVFISTKMQNFSDFRDFLGQGFINGLSKDILNGTNAKIDVEAVRRFKSRLNKDMNDAGVAELFDIVKLLHSFLSKDVASGRLNGFFNLYVAFVDSNATSAEIESALGYLYGTETTVPKLTLSDIPNPTPAECPDVSESYSIAIDELKLVDSIKPKVIEDVIAIRDQFPCIGIVGEFVEKFVNVAGHFALSDSSCKRDKKGVPSNFSDFKFEVLEFLLPIRLPDETFRGMMNFLKAIEIGTPIKPGNTLEYLYFKAPIAKCTELNLMTSTSS